MASFGVSPLDAERRRLERRRALVDILQKQALAGPEMPNVPGAQMSPYQGLAKMGEALIAALANRAQEKREKEFAGKELEQQKQTAQAMTDYLMPYKPYTPPTPGMVETPTEMAPISSQLNLTTPMRPIPQNVQQLQAASQMRAPEMPEPVSAPPQPQGEQRSPYGAMLAGAVTRFGENQNQRTALASALASGSPLGNIMAQDIVSQRNRKQELADQLELLREKEKLDVGVAAPGSAIIQGGKVIGNVPQATPAAPRPQAPITVAPGSAVFDPNTGRALFTNPAQENKRPNPANRTVVRNGKEVIEYFYPDQPNQVIATVPKGKIPEKEAASIATQAPSHVQSAAALLSTQMTNDQAQRLYRTLDLYNGDVAKSENFLYSQLFNSKDATGSTKERLSTLKDVMSGLNQLEQLFDEARMQGGTGLVNGTSVGIQNAFGFLGKEKVAEAQQAIKLLIQKYTHGMSGASFTDNEKKSYTEVFPSTMNESSLNEVKLRQLKAMFSENMKNYLSDYLGNDFADSFMSRIGKKPKGKTLNIPANLSPGVKKLLDEMGR